MALYFYSTCLLAFDYSSEKSYENPLRQLSIIIAKEGYYPDKITVFKGEKVKFFLTNSTSKQSCMVIREKSLFMSSQIGQISEGEAIFDTVGAYKFYCPTGNISGELTVLDKPSTIMKREVASEKENSKVRYWLPKDE